jgi:hypothetical protein
MLMMAEHGHRDAILNDIDAEFVLSAAILSDFRIGWLPID